MRKTPPPTNPITQLLAAAGDGDVVARDRLWGLIYDELHRLARQQLAGDAAKRHLQPTTLVNEAYLRLVGDGHVQWADRRHFFGAAAQAMRRIRVEDARRRRRLKRGGGRRPEPAGTADGRNPLDNILVFDRDPVKVIALDEALRRLEERDPCKAEVVLLRFFAGLSVEETAKVLGISPRGVDKEWAFARAWLHRELSK